jgi:hypothetical protein
MTLDAERKRELDHWWIDSLLIETQAAEPVRNDQRIQELLEHTDFQAAQIVHENRTDNKPFVSWVPLTLAATLLIGLSGWWLFTPASSNAYAAIDRSLKSVPMVRKYVVHVRANAVDGKPLERDIDLFLDSNDRFVVHAQGWLGGELWHGDDGQNRWLVPALGPALVGDERLLSRWLIKKDDSAPYLYLRTMLMRMKQGYQLESLSDEVLSDAHGNGKVTCQHVRGMVNPKQKGMHGKSPNQIDLAWHIVSFCNGIETRANAARPNGPLNWPVFQIWMPVGLNLRHTCDLDNA